MFPALMMVRKIIILFTFCKAFRHCWNPNTFRYTGTVSTTRSGVKCQNWYNNYPHRVSRYHVPKNPFNNFCRNPDKDENGPWCYTTDPQIQAEYCDVPKCRPPSSISSQSRRPSSINIETLCNCWSPKQAYAGHISVTSSGRSCQKWSSNFPHRTKYRPLNTNHNNCRNPDHDSNGPWCYTTDPAKRYEFCNIKQCVAGRCDPIIEITTKRTTTRPNIRSTATSRAERLSNTPTNGDQCIVEQSNNANCGISARPYLFTEKENPTCLNTALEETPCMNGIVGGSDTISDRSWPWQIQLVGSWMCGGALITPRTVVTASHCLKNTYARDWQVSAGHVNKDQTIASREPGFQRKPVIRILKHRDYNDAYQNDITLLFVRDPFLYTNYVRPACLPGSAQYNCKLHSGTKCIISGWGDTRQSSQTYDLALQHTTVPIVARTECLSMLGTGGTQVTSRMLCAGIEGNDTCQGDSGGPLICHINGYYALFGITSWGYDCGKDNSPGVYTDVIQYLPWIHTNKIN